MRRFKLAAASGLALLSTVASAWAQNSAPTLTPPIPSPSELVFTPIPPCRAFLTSTALAANEARSFVVVGTSAEFAAQGGPSTGCGVPPSAAAVAISLTSFASTGTGHLRAAAFGDAITTTQVLSFRANATETASVTAAVKSRKLTIKAYTAGTKIAGDVTGYYAPQIRAHIRSDGLVITGTTRIRSATQGSQDGEYIVSIDRDPTQCTALATTEYAFITAGTSIKNGAIYIRIYNNYAGLYVENYFNLIVSC